MSGAKYDIRSRFCCVRNGLEQLEQRQMLSGTPQLLADINTTAPNAYSSPSGFIAVGDSILFTASDGVHGPELWRTDGTTEGTELLYDLRPGSSGGGMGPRIMFEGNLLFHATVGTGNYQLWRSDGTANGTTFVSNVSYSNGLEYNGKILFNGEGNLYVTDGTSEGTGRVAGGPTTSLGLAPRNFAELNGLVYFGGRIGTGVDDFGLWRTDGTKDGKELLSSSIRSPIAIAAVNGRLVYQSTSSNYYSSDGSDDGELLLPASPRGRAGTDLVVVNDIAYFAYYRTDGTWDEDLWRTDGTPEGTFPIKQVRAERLIAVGNELYFLGTTSDSDWELWKSDGTTEGTVRVKDIRSGEVGAFGSNDSHLLAEANGVLYFRADDGTGPRLWRTDGTEDGTWMVPGSPLDPLGMTNINGTLYFSARDDDHGRELWVLRPESQVVGRQIFYNNSKFDGGFVAANATDDGAIATDKVAHLPGSGIATTASVSNYSRGINGVMIDIANLDGAISASDFTFRIGTGNSPESWVLGPAPLEVVVRAGAGVDGSDRVTITWADGAIKNTWLQVIVRGNDAAGGFNTNTGLAASDVFFFGNRVGDTFVNAAPAATVTSSQDELGARFNPGINQPVSNVFDFNRDGVVNAADQLIARNNAGLLLMIDVDAVVDEELAEALVAESLATEPVVLAVASSPTSRRAALAFALATESLDDDPADELIAGWRRARR